MVGCWLFSFTNVTSRDYFDDSLPTLQRLVNVPITLGDLFHKNSHICWR